jgi:hypothetical protein
MTIDKTRPHEIEVRWTPAEVWAIQRAGLRDLALERTGNGPEEGEAEPDACADPGCEIRWRDHTTEQAERCVAYAMRLALDDPRDEAELADEAAAGAPVHADLERRAAEREEVRRVLFPEAVQEAER